MSALRAAAALLLVGCGWCAGGAVQARLAAHENALRRTLALLRRIRREVAFSHADLGALCARLKQEGEWTVRAASLQTLAPPPELTQSEGECFTECMAGLGRAAAPKECERLDGFIARFEEYLEEARRQTQAKAPLTRRLGLAAGALAALFIL